MTTHRVDTGVTGAADTTAPIFSSTFDRSAWRLEPKRLNSAACMVAFSIALWSLGGAVSGSLGTAHRVTAVAVLVETLLLCLPWRLPRDERGPVSFWAESLVGLLAPVTALVAAVAVGASWLTTAGDWWWYALALLGGVGLFALGGLNPRAVFNGQMAFLLGPTPRSHARARAFTAAVGPFGEEALFRAPVLAAAATTPFGLLAAVGFVARHHVQPGSNRRGNARSTLVEIGGAALLLALTLASGSVYPALLCHLLNNIPSVLMELQRDEGGDDEDW